MKKHKFSSLSILALTLFFMVHLRCAAQNGASTGITQYIENVLNKNQKQKTNKFCFGLAADTHLNFGGPDRWRDKEMLDILNSWAKAKATFGIIVGDVGSYKTVVKFGDKEVSQTDKLLELIKSVPGCPPIFFTMGNHELDGDGKKVWLEALYPGAVKNIKGNGNEQYFYFSFNYGQSHFICLDTNRVLKKSILYKTMPEEEWEWLQQDLEKYKGKLTFVFIHEPLEDFYYVGKGKGARLTQGVTPYHIFTFRGRLIRLFNKFPNVKWVFSGHRHLYTHFKNFWGMNICKIGYGRSRIVKVDGKKAELFDADKDGILTPVKLVDHDKLFTDKLQKKGNSLMYRIGENSVMKVNVKYNSLAPSLSFSGTENGIKPTSGITMMKVEKDLTAKGEQSFTPLNCYISDDIIKITKGMKLSYDVYFDPASVYDNFAIDLRIIPGDGKKPPQILDQNKIPMNNIGWNKYEKYGWKSKTYHSPSLEKKARGKWYHREFDLSALAGEYISMIELYATRPDKAPYPRGKLKFYVDNIALTWPETKK